MDVTTMTDDQIRAEIGRLAQELEARQLRRAQAEAQLTQDVGDTIQSLESLLGPVNPTAKSLASIREAMLYTQTEAQQAAGVAILKVLGWLEKVAANQVALARVVSGVVEDDPATVQEV